MRLYFHPASYNSRRALVVAHAVGVPVELVLVDLFTGEQRSPAYLALNPNGLVPTLVDGDVVLWESTAVAHYLAEKAGSVLVGRTAAERADILRWEAWGLAHLARATDIFLFENLIKGAFGLGAPDPTALAAAADQFHKWAAVLEAHLEGRSWLAGDGVTLADLSLATIIFSADATGVPWKGYPNIVRWYGSVTDLPAWKAASG